MSRNSRNSFTHEDLGQQGRNLHSLFSHPCQIALASLVVGLGLTSALALSIAGYAHSNAMAEQNQAAIAKAESQTAHQAKHLTTIASERQHQIQSLAQLSLLSHEKIRSSLTAGEQWQALTQYSAGYDGYESITFVDLQNNVRVDVQGNGSSPELPSVLRQTAIAQGSVVDNLADNNLANNIGENPTAVLATGLQIIAPVLDAATGQTIGTMEAVVSAQTLTTALEAPTNRNSDNRHSEAQAGNREGTIAFQLQEDLALMMSLSLPLAAILLAGLILFWDRQIHQALALSPHRLQQLVGMGDRP